MKVRKPHGLEAPEELPPSLRAEKAKDNEQGRSMRTAALQRIGTLSPGRSAHPCHRLGRVGPYDLDGDLRVSADG